MTDRQLLQLARRILTPDEFAVWVLKHYTHHGRRTGSHHLGITETQWRYRLNRAQLRIQQHLEEHAT